MDTINKIVNKMQHPVEKEPIEHPAHHGASLEHHNPPEGLLARMFSPETTKQIQSQGNNGQGMEMGLNNKTIKQMERVAERSRLKADGFFVPHMKHDMNTHLTPEHLRVAQGDRVSFDNEVSDNLPSTTFDDSDMLEGWGSPTSSNGSGRFV